MYGTEDSRQRLKAFAKVTPPLLAPPKMAPPPLAPPHNSSRLMAARLDRKLLTHTPAYTPAAPTPMARTT